MYANNFILHTSYTPICLENLKKLHKDGFHILPKKLLLSLTHISRQQSNSLMTKASHLVRMMKKFLPSSNQKVIGSLPQSF